MFTNVTVSIPIKMCTTEVLGIVAGYSANDMRFRYALIKECAM